MRIPMISLAVVGAVALGGCAYGYGDYGYGYGGGYGDYDYSPYGYGLGGYYGWYDNFYYPGTGIYVYDVHRRRHTWNDRQRSYWNGRRDNVVRTTSVGARPVMRENWSGFRQRPGRRH